MQRKVKVPVRRDVLVDAERAYQALRDPSMSNDLVEHAELMGVLVGCLREMGVALEFKSPVLARAMRIAAAHYDEQVDELLAEQTPEASAS